jgi:hypothetical protein
MGGGSGTGFWADKFVPTKATKQALKKTFMTLWARFNEMRAVEVLDSSFLRRTDLPVREGVTASGVD